MFLPKIYPNKGCLLLSLSFNIIQMLPSVKSGKKRNKNNMIGKELKPSPLLNNTSFFLSFKLHLFISGHQAWQQVPLFTEPSYKPNNIIFYIEISKVPAKRLIKPIIGFSVPQDIKINAQTSIAFLCYTDSEQLVCAWNLKHITSYNHDKGNEVLRYTLNILYIGSICYKIPQCQ